MKKYSIFVCIAILVIILAVIFFFNYKRNNNNIEPIQQNDSNQGTFRNVNEEQAENRIANILKNANEIIQNTSNENEISSYSTIIKDKEAGRLTNIGITCSILNNTIIRKR